MSGRSAARLSVAELQQAPEDALARLRSGEVVVLTAGGEVVAVMLSPDLFQRHERERELLRRLALGELEAAAGEGHDLAQVLEECDLLLDEQ